MTDRVPLALLLATLLVVGLWSASVRAQPVGLESAASAAANAAANAASGTAAPSASMGAEPASRAASARRPLRARPAGDRPYVYQGTANGDNLWDIAGAVVGPAGQGEPIDRNQVMVAIYRANPAAFPEGNMHRIQRGLDLTVPSRADIRREDRQQAAALVAQHRRAYADRRLTAQPLYALAGQSAASSARAAGSASAASAGEGAIEASAPGGGWSGVPAWLLVTGAVVVAGVAAVALRAGSRRPLLLDPMALDPLALDPSPGHAAGDDLDAQAQAERDRQRADAAAASLYQEDLSLPAEDAPKEGPMPAAPGSATVAVPEEAFGDALADAYAELKRPAEGAPPGARGAAAA